MERRVFTAARPDAIDESSATTNSQADYTAATTGRTQEVNGQLS